MISEKIFETYSNLVGECIKAPIAEIYKVKVGSPMIINTSLGIDVEVTADKNGWHAKFNSKRYFISDEEFKENFISEKAQGTEPFPDNAKITPVKKGETIIVQPWSDTALGVETTAEKDGYVITLPENGKARFWEKSTFHAIYKTDRVPPLSEENRIYRYLPPENKTSVLFLILPKNITIDFKEGAYNGKAGEVLFENEKDVDGYTIDSADAFAKAFLVTKNPVKVTKPQNFVAQ